MRQTPLSHAPPPPRAQGVDAQHPYLPVGTPPAGFPYAPEFCAWVHDVSPALMGVEVTPSMLGAVGLAIDANVAGAFLSGAIGASNGRRAARGLA